ncbi:hypothetical protein FUAX_07080 [Fulvitalea axinellae]|uniref:HEAT repeat domain-containing protein n=1 Tax=Fulvitalea axinellae TaxID=1182444 RepID=A0AAU9D630_9BACT|nr:hypothetical protein FUAX_07080 [Fulvitalea axinellae]
MRCFLIVIALLTTNVCFSQIKLSDAFLSDLEKAYRQDFSKQESDKLYRSYPEMLTPYSKANRLFGAISGKPFSDSPYPLSSLKQDSVFKRKLRELYNSDNIYHRRLSYSLIASTGDTTYLDKLFDRIDTEKEKGCRSRMYIALLHMKTPQTTRLFDYLAKDSLIFHSHFAQAFVKLNSDSVRNTCYKRINTDEHGAKYFAGSLLASTGNTPKTVRLLREKAMEWSPEKSLYALYALGYLKQGNLLPLSRRLEGTKFGVQMLHLLANSPTKEDSVYLMEQTRTNAPVSKDLLNAFFRSERPGWNLYGLRLVQEKRIPEAYIFYFPKCPLIKSGNAVDEVLRTIQLCGDKPKIIRSLISTLKGKDLEKTKPVISPYLRHSDKRLSSAAFNMMKADTSASFLNEIKTLALDSAHLNSIIVDILIRNGINEERFKTFFRAQFRANSLWQTQKACLKYLAAFPSYEDDFKFFVRLIEDPNTQPRNQGFKIIAITGLGNLKTDDSVPVIITDFESRMKKRKGLRLRNIGKTNVFPHLKTLKKIGNPEADKYLFSLLESEDEDVKAFVNKLLLRGHQ